MLNVFDGIVLHIMIFTSVKSIFDGLSTGLLSAIITALVTIPLTTFITMEMIVYKEYIRKIFTYCKPKPVTKNYNSEFSPNSDIGFVIDDSMRMNATTVDM